jgi:hypothetical protein
LNNNLLLAKDRDEYTLLHYTQYSDNVQILQRIWNLAKDHLSPEEFNKFLLAGDKRMKTALKLAADRDKVKILDKLLEWAQHRRVN